MRRAPPKGAPRLRCTCLPCGSSASCSTPARLAAPRYARPTRRVRRVRWKLTSLDPPVAWSGLSCPPAPPVWRVGGARALQADARARSALQALRCCTGAGGSITSARLFAPASRWLLSGAGRSRRPCGSARPARVYGASLAPSRFIGWRSGCCPGAPLSRAPYGWRCIDRLQWVLVTE